MRRALRNGWKRVTTFVLATAMVVTMIPANVRASASSDNGDGTFDNPAIYADVPDVDIIRVEDAYYMVSTTMHLSPGCPIMKSTDLVNWETVNYVFHTLDDVDAMKLQNGLSMYGKGQEAASLKYQNGTYYVSFNSDSTGKSYIFTTKDIEKGKWKKYVLEGVHKNPTLFFDDNKQYIIYGDGEIKCAEFTLSDVTFTVETAGTEKKLFDVVTGDNASGKTAGGTHIIKKDNFYYIFHAAFSDGKLAQVCHRTNDFANGTWEEKTIIAANDDITQSGVIDKADGTWYGFLMTEQGAVGNVPVLTGCTWTDNWPVLAGTADVASASDGKALTKSDNFDNIVEEEPEDETGNQTGTEGEEVPLNLIFQNGKDWNYNDFRENAIKGKKGIWTEFSFEYEPKANYGTDSTTNEERVFSNTQNKFFLEGGTYTRDGKKEYMDIYLDDVSLKEKADNAEELVTNGSFDGETIENWAESVGYDADGAHRATLGRVEDPKNSGNFVLGITERGLHSATALYKVGSGKMELGKTYILSGRILCMEKKTEKIVELVKNGDFEDGKGTKGWESVDGAQISVVEDGYNHVMKVSGRKDFPSSAAYDLTGEIQKGKKYTVSGRLKYTVGDAEKDFLITFQNGPDKWTQRQTKYWPPIKAKKDQWVDFSIEFTPGVDGDKELSFSPTKNLMFIQTPWHSTDTNNGGTPYNETDLTDFYFDDISITGPDPFGEEAGELITNGDFEGDKGAEGWTVNGVKQEDGKWVPAAKISVESEGVNKVLKVTDREAFDGGAKFDLTGKIQKGKKYTVSGRIKYTGTENTVATKQFNVAFQNGPDYNYRQSNGITLTKDEWKEFEFKYVPWDVSDKYPFSSENNFIYFETPYQNQTTPTKESDYMDYYIDDISVVLGEKEEPVSKLDTHWQWNHNPDNDAWSLLERKGWLRLYAGKATSLLDARNTLTQRTFGPTCSGKLKMDISHMSAGDVAGLAAFSYNYGYIAVKKEADGAKLVMVDASENTDVEAAKPVEKANAACTGDTVYLKEDFNFAGNEDGSGKDTVTFYYSFDEETWTKLGTPMTMTRETKNAMGYRYAIFNYATDDASQGYVDYDSFRVSDKITGEGPSEKEEEYTVIFDVNGGNELSDADATRTVIEGDRIGTLPIATRDGYTFKGWYTEQEDGEKVTAATTVNSDMTLYARWEKDQEQPGTQEWTVNFDVNGGNALSAADATKKVPKGAAIGELPTATRDEHTFLGWYTEATGGTKVETTTLVTSDMTLYARWQQNQPGTETCTVTFDVNGGNELTNKTRIVTKGDKIGDLPTTTRDGYTLKGWFKAKTGDDAVTKDTIVNGDMMVYAQWDEVKENECVVTLNPCEGTVEKTQIKVTKGQAIGDLPIPVREGYTFKGWFTAETGGDQVTKDTVFSENKTIFARWEETTTQPDPDEEAKEQLKTQLNGQISEAQKVLAQLSDAEKTKLQTVINKVNALLTSGTATKEDLQAAVNELTQAVEAAKKTIGSGGNSGNTNNTGTDKPAVGQTFTVDGLTYIVTSYSGSAMTVTVTGADKQLTTLVIPAAVTYKNETFKVTAIGKQAFANQKSLKSVTVGENVTTIESGAFLNDANLTKITFNGAGVQSIANDAFKGINKKASFGMKVKSFTSKNIKYSVTKNTASVKEVTVTGTSAKKLTSLTVPDTVKYNGMTFKVTAINKKAFRNQKNLKSVTIGKNVKSIGNDAFSGAKKLAKVKFKGTAIKKIGKNAFKNVKKNATFSIKRSKRANLKKLLKKAKTKNYKVK